MSITKTGILNENLFLEQNGYLNDKTIGSYTPTTATNSTYYPCGTIDFSNIAELGLAIPLNIEFDLSWTDFTGYGAGGTFDSYFQGSNRQKETGNFVWAGTSYPAAAGNNAGRPSTLIKASPTGGSAHCEASITIPASWFDTYNASKFGFRTNYSNGTGTITISNLRISFGQTSNGQASITNQYIIGNNLYEY